MMVKSRSSHSPQDVVAAFAEELLPNSFAWARPLAGLAAELAAGVPTKSAVPGGSGRSIPFHSNCSVAGLSGFKAAKVTAQVPHIQRQVGDLRRATGLRTAAVMLWTADVANEFAAPGDFCTMALSTTVEKGAVQAATAAATVASPGSRAREAVCDVSCWCSEAVLFFCCTAGGFTLTKLDQGIDDNTRSWVELTSPLFLLHRRGICADKTGSRNR
jgi:hypothetical protein